VERGPIFKLLAAVLLAFVPGFYAVDAWVGWLDARGRADAGDDYYLADEQLGWVPRPHFENPEFETVLDSHGLRSPELPAVRSPGELRIAGFGASQVYGAAGVRQSDTWSARLERELAGERVRVLNGGVMGYSTVQACRRAIRLLPELDLDLLFVLVSPGPQSMLDPSSSRNWVRSGGQLVRRDVVEGWPELLHPLLVAWDGLLLRSNLYERQRAKRALGNEDREASIQRWVLSRAEPSPAVAGMLDLTFDELAALAAAAQAHGVEFAVLVFPEQEQDDPRRWEAYCRNNAPAGAPAPGTPRHEPTEVLVERCRALGLETWDFTEVADRLGQDRARLLAEDGRHWSSEGHALVAEELARRLRAGLLDELRARRPSGS
jgi:lysophospholipase L1-like esterase